MNLVDKIKQEQEVKASQQSIANAEKRAKTQNIKEQLTDITNVALAEWFMTEVNVGSDMFPSVTYDELVDKKSVQFELDRLYIVEEKQNKTKIASLIYGSNPSDNYVERNTTYAGSTFRICIGTKAVDRIMLGLEEMGVSISTKMVEPMACNQKPYQVTVLSV